MSFEEEFDKIIKDKSEELEYPFDEKNWDKASAMLDAERNAAAPRAMKRFLPLLIAGLLVTSAVVVGVSYLQPGPQAETKTGTGQATLANNSTAIQQVNSAETGVAANANKEENTSPHISTNETTSAPAKTSTSLKTPATAPAKGTERANENAPAVTVANTSVLQAPVVAAVETRQQSARIRAARTGPVVATANPQDAASSSPANAGGSNESITGNTRASSGNGNVPARNTAENAGTAAASPQPVATGKTNQAENTEVAGNSPVTETVNNGLFDNTVVVSGYEALPLVWATEQDRAESELMATPLNYMQRYDEDYYRKKLKTHYLTAELGGTYLLGWHTAAGMDGKGLDWFGGFNYGYYITRKISISAGIQAYNIKNITQAFYTNKEVHYDFGSITSNTIITSNSLYYVAAPVKFNYMLNKTSDFSVGANLGYMVDSRNTVETYQVQEGVKIHNKVVKNAGMYQNANSWNIMLSGAYRVEVLPRLHLNTEVVYGVSDIFKNTKTIKNNEQAMGIRISLQYALFDK